MKVAFIKRVTVVAMAAAMVSTTVVPVVSNPTAVEAATKKTDKATLKKARFKASAISLSKDGNTICVSGVKLVANKKVTVSIDGKKAAVDHMNRSNEDGKWMTQIYLKSALDAGTHKISVQEKGYKAVTKNVKYEAAKDKLVLYNPSVGENNGKQQVVVCANPNVDAAQVKCTIDGTEVTSTWNGPNGDGLLMIGYDISQFGIGTHAIEVSSEGYESYAGTITIAAMFGVRGVNVGKGDNGEDVLFVCMSPEVNPEKVKCTIDGVEVTARWHNINGDGLLMLGYDASKFVSGEHEITLSGEGYATYTDIFIVK